MLKRLISKVDGSVKPDAKLAGAIRVAIIRRLSTILMLTKRSFLKGVL
nr:hypothetical protein [Tanacetum cinerariifolium]